MGYRPTAMGLCTPGSSRTICLMEGANIEQLCPVACLVHQQYITSSCVKCTFPRGSAHCFSTAVLMSRALGRTLTPSQTMASSCLQILTSPASATWQWEPCRGQWQQSRGQANLMPHYCCSFCPHCRGPHVAVFCGKFQALPQMGYIKYPKSCSLGHHSITTAANIA